MSYHDALQQLRAIATTIMDVVVRIKEAPRKGMRHEGASLHIFAARERAKFEKVHRGVCARLAHEEYTEATALMDEIENMRRGVYRSFIQVVAFQFEKGEIAPEEAPRWCKALVLIVEKGHLVSYEELPVPRQTWELIHACARHCPGPE